RFDTQIDFRLAQSRRVGGDANITSQGEFQSATQAEAVNHSNNGLGKLLDRIKNSALLHHITLGQSRTPFEFADVRTGDKCFISGAGHDDDAGGAALQLVESLQNFVAGRLVQRVSFVRSVYGEYSDYVKSFEQDVFISHA